MPNESEEGEEMGRSGYYHGTPLFPPPPATAAPIPWPGGDERPLRVRGKVKGMFNA